MNKKELQSLLEGVRTALTGDQSKLDKNQNNKIDREDFTLLRSKKKPMAENADLLALLEHLYGVLLDEKAARLQEAPYGGWLGTQYSASRGQSANPQNFRAANQRDNDEIRMSIARSQEIHKATDFPLINSAATSPAEKTRAKEEKERQRRAQMDQMENARYDGGRTSDPTNFYQRNREDNDRIRMSIVRAAAEEERKKKEQAEQEEKKRLANKMESAEYDSILEKIYNLLAEEGVPPMLSPEDPYAIPMAPPPPWLSPLDPNPTPRVDPILNPEGPGGGTIQDDLYGRRFYVFPNGRVLIWDPQSDPPRWSLYKYPMLGDQNLPFPNELWPWPIGVLTPQEWLDLINRSPHFQP